jgi:Xaa-Pro aminopeptidase
MIAQLIKDAGMADMPVGVDYAETAMFHALQEEGIKVVDGQQIMLARARSRTGTRSSC